MDASGNPSARPACLRPADRDRIEFHIRQRTGGRVRFLDVAVGDDGRVLIRGLTASYYTRQLAVQAAKEALPPTQTFDVLIEVR